MEKRIDDDKYAKVVDFHIKQIYLLFVERRMYGEMNRQFVCE